MVYSKETYAALLLSRAYRGASRGAMARATQSGNEATLDPSSISFRKSAHQTINSIICAAIATRRLRRGGAGLSDRETHAVLRPTPAGQNFDERRPCGGPRARDRGSRAGGRQGGSCRGFEQMHIKNCPRGNC